MSDASKINLPPTGDNTFLHLGLDNKTLARTAIKAISRPDRAFASILKTELKKELNDTEKNAARARLNKDIRPMVLNEYLDSVNPDWVNWLPETIYSEVEFDSNETLSLEVKSKIMAIKTVRTVKDLERDPMTFENVITAFNNNVPNWEIVEKPPLHEIVFGAREILHLNPEFAAGEEVEAFIVSIMRDDGVLYLPWLDISVNDCNLSKAGSDLCKIIDGLKKAWKNIDSKYDFVKDLNLKADNPLSVQIDRLMDIRAYLDAMETDK